LGPIPNPQSPIPNPQSPIPNYILIIIFIKLKKTFKKIKKFVLLKYDFSENN